MSERRESAREVRGAVSGAGSTVRAATGPTSTEQRRERWRWRAIYAVGVFGILYVGFLVGVIVVGAGNAAPAATAKVEAAREQGASVPASAASVPAVGMRRNEGDRPAVAALPVSPQVALEAAVPALRGCAAMAGEEVMIEISVEAGRETVVKGEALGHDVDAVGACVRTVAAGLRFAPPTKAETIMKEVQP